jgi:recombinational DNA repair protein (RecF pathway)
MFGQYDIGYLCELLFYERDHNGIHIIKECSTVDSRDSCRGNWQLTSAVSYLCHLAEIATPDGAHAPELYELLADTLQRIASSPARQWGSDNRPAVPDQEVDSLTQRASHIPPLLFWFELQLLDLLGVPPQIQRCTSCGCATATELTAFSARRGGAICKRCESLASAAELESLPGDVLAILRRWQSAGTFDALSTISYSDLQRQQMNRLLGAFLVYHLDLAPECRSVAYHMLDTVIRAVV